ncbi:hypothetical protein [Aquifex aeolicus]|nr:hypothetical protein [Aquifex aeolicus]
MLTSNLFDLTGERQIFRRACFLPFEVQISSKKSVNKLLGKANNSLFLKFLKCVNPEKIELKEEDPLYFSRDFLLNEGIPVPENYYGNFERAMLKGWKKLYLTSPEKFEEVRYYHKQDQKKLVPCYKVQIKDAGYLTPLEEFDNGFLQDSYLILKEEFLKTIGVSEKRNIFTSLFSVIRISKR